MFKRMLVGLLVAGTLGMVSTGVWVISAASASPAPTCTDTWNAGANGDWGTAADWTNSSNAHVVPTASDVACWGAGITLTVGSTDTAATAASVQGGSLDITGTPNVAGELTLAGAGSTSTLQNLLVTVGSLEGPGDIALTGSFEFTGVDTGTYHGEPAEPDIGVSTPLAISQTGGGTFELGQNDCVTMHEDVTFTTTSPVTLGCTYMLPDGGSLMTTSSMTLTPGAYPAAAGSRMNVTAEGYNISGSTVPQGFNLYQDGGTTTIPSGDNFTPGVGFTLDSGTIVIDGPESQFSLGPGQLSNGLTMNGGTLTGAGQINSVLNQTGGVVVPGLSGVSNTLTVAGGYIQGAGGTLHVSASGTAAADLTNLAVTGSVELHGTLEITPTGGYETTAAVGDSLDVLQYTATLTGAFSTVTSDTTLANGDTFTGDYTTSDQVDAVVTAPATQTTTTTTTQSATTPSTTTPSTTAPTTSTPTQTTPATVFAGPTPAAAAVASPAPSTSGKPAISGTPLPGETLTCDPGTWTGNPSFSYQWVLGTSPITGATARTYTVTILDEGQTITCAVAAHSTGGTTGAISPGVVVAQAGTLTCPKPGGSFSPQKIGPFALGETRTQARKSFHDWKVIQSGFDNFCLYGGWGIRGAYKSNKFALLDTANPYYKLKGVSPGDTVKALEKKIKLGKVIVIGKNSWYVAIASTSNYVFKTRQGIVEEIGIANKQDSTGYSTQKRFLSSFKAD